MDQTVEAVDIIYVGELSRQSGDNNAIILAKRQ